jgi:prepilin-type N-terminal cleavage/methylation domain-containing protein
MTRTRNARTRNRGRSGFTLIETAIATVIIGLGVTALLVAVGSGTRVNNAGRKLTQATFLAQELREWTLRLPFSDQDSGDANNPPGPDGTSPQTFVDDLDDLMGVTYSPPRSGQGSAITDMTHWSETIELTWRDPDDLQTVVADGASNMVYVQVSISHKDREILETGWLIINKE